LPTLDASIVSVIARSSQGNLLDFGDNLIQHIF